MEDELREEIRLLREEIRRLRADIANHSVYQPTYPMPIPRYQSPPTWTNPTMHIEV